MDYGSKEMMRRVQEVSEGEKDIYIYIKGGGEIRKSSIHGTIRLSGAPGNLSGPCVAKAVG